MSLGKSFKNIILAGIFCLPLIPLIITSSFLFPFITGKAFAFRIIVSIVFLSWVGLVFLNKEYLPKKSWILYSTVSFLVVLVFSAIFGIDPYRSFWSTFERMEGLITLFYLVGLFVVMISVLKEKDWKIFFHISLVTSAVMCFYGFLQLAGSVDIRQSGFRLDGTLGNAIYLAVYLMFHIFIGIFYFFQRRDNYRYLYLFLIATQVFILYNTATRGVTLALIFGLAVTFFLLLVFGKEHKSLRKKSLVLLLLLLVFLGAFWFFKESSFVKESPVLSRFSTISLEGIKEQGRYFVWPMAIEGFKERPILGYGQENFIHIFSENYNPAMYGHEPWFDRVHNVYLDWLVAGGILALLFFLLIIFSSIFYLWKTPNFSILEKSVLSGFLAAYLFQGIFDFDNLTSYILLFSILAFICYKSAPGESIKLPFVGLPFAHAKTIILSALVAVFFISGYFLHYKPILAAKTIIDAIHPQTANQDSLEHFKKFFSYNTFGNQEGLIHFLNKASMVIASDNPEELKLDFFNLAQDRISVQTERFPLDARVLISSGVFFRQVEQYDRSLEMLERASKLSPKKQSIYFEIASTLFSASRFEEAMEVLESAKNLWPENPESRTFYLMALLANDRLSEANSEWEILPDSVKYFDDRLLNTLAEIKQYSKVLEIWQNRVEFEPENLESRQALVASYLSLRNWPKAIEELEKIVEIDPNFKNTADYAISEIRAGRGAGLLAN